MAPSGRHVGIAQHPRDLLHPPLTRDHRHITGRETVLFALGDHDVVICMHGDLRQVRDDERLAVPSGDARQRRADANADFSADPLIHLVEHEGRHRIVRREHDFQGEHQPR